MAMILLSWGWNARKVEAGGGDMNVVITCRPTNLLKILKIIKLTILCKTCMCRQTLNVIMLNSETFPPVADITYESFFERAMHGTASSRLTPETSLVIRRPLFGCQCCGTTLAVAFLNTNQLQKSIQR
jgi:hypothetical protein